MQTVDYLDHIRRDADAFTLAARAGLDAPVPSCPEWDVRGLLVHLGDVHRWVTEIVRSRTPERISRDFAPADDEEPIAWFTSGADDLLAVLGSAPDDAAVWNWSSAPDVAAFWPRRMGHETAVHRWDAENAHGAGKPIDADLASDGLSELFEVVLPRMAQARNLSVPGTLHVHCTDVRGEWLLELTDGEPIVRREHAKGDVAWRGAASDLLLASLGRVPLSEVDVLGDPEVAEQWLGALAFE